MRERLERLEDEIFHLGEAIDHLNHVSGCEDYVTLLEDKLAIARLERAATHLLCEMQDDSDEDDLRREYEQSTI